MISPALLREYLVTNFPEQFAAGDDGAMLAGMMDSGGTKTGGVSPGAFATWAASGPRSAIEDHAVDPTSPLRASALALRDFLGGSMPVFDLALPETSALLTAWTAMGAITQEQHDSLITIAQHPITVAERDGFSGLTMDDIVAARSLAP